MTTQPQVKMTRYGSLWIGSYNGRTINAFRCGKVWFAKSGLVCYEGKTMQEAIRKVINDFWF